MRKKNRVALGWQVTRILWGSINTFDLDLVYVQELSESADRKLWSDLLGQYKDNKELN